MKHVIKKIAHLYREIDISPLNRSGSAFRTIIFLIWACNALVFFADDFLIQDDYASHTLEHNIAKYTLELSSVDINPDITITFYSASIGIITSYDVNPHEFEINPLQHDRSPPF